MTEKQWNLTKPTPVQSKLVPRAGFLADGEWHTMILRMEKTNLSIAVDQNLVAAEEPGWMNSDHDELDLFIGKALNWSLGPDFNNFRYLSLSFFYNFCHFTPM